MATHVLIQTITVGSGGAASIEFSSIPQTYTDLVIYASGRSSDSALYASTKVTFNNNSTGYSGRYLQGDGATASGQSFAQIVGFDPAATATASIFSNVSIYIPNYAGSTNKTYSVESVSENNASSGGTYQILTAGYWGNTSAITVVTLAMLFGSNYVQYSSASLYGIKNS